MVINRLAVVMYHYVHPIAGTRFPGIRGLEPSQFKGQLDYLQKHHKIITMEELLKSLQSDAPLPQKSVLLTFDDGYTDHFDYVAPELDKRGIRGAFFPVASAALDRRPLAINKIHYAIASCMDKSLLVDRLEEAISRVDGAYFRSHVDILRSRHFFPTRLDSAEIIYVKRLLQSALPQSIRERVIADLFEESVGLDDAAFAESMYCTIDQLADLSKRGHFIGCHGDAHPWLEHLTRQEQEADILGGLRVHRALGLSNSDLVFCYPFGSYNRETIELLSAMQFKAAFTCRVAMADLRGDKPHELPRLDTIDFPFKGNSAPNDWSLS